MPSIGKSATEAQIQATICQWLALAGIPFTITDAAHVTINGVTRGRSKIRTGWPDITAVLPPEGTLLAIEVKSARGKLRPEQVETIAQLQDAGALTVVARSVEDVVGSVCGYYIRSGHDRPSTMTRAVHALLG